MAKNALLPDESDQDAITTVIHIFIVLHLLISKGFINLFLKIMWYIRDILSKEYRCKSTIYLLYCLDLEFSTSIGIDVGIPGLVNHVVYYINYRGKQILEFSM